MKIAALLIALAVAGALFMRQHQQSAAAEHAETAEAAALLPTTPGAAPAAPCVYKRALDSAQAVAGQVRAQQAERAAEDP